MKFTRWKGSVLKMIHNNLIGGTTQMEETKENERIKQNNKGTWKTGSYHREDIDSSTYFTTLTPVAIIKKYHIFRMDNGGIPVVIFSDQHDIIDLVEGNPGSVFSIRFFQESNSKYEYDVVCSTGNFVARTIAGAMILAHKRGDKDRTIKTTDEGFITLD